MEAVIVALLFLVVILQLFPGRQSREERRAARRQARIERKLDLLLEHLGIADVQPELAEVQAHLDQGNKIAAIRAYREATGADLKAAKDAVDRMA